MRTLIVIILFAALFYIIDRYDVIQYVYTHTVSGMLIDENAPTTTAGTRGGIHEEPR
jgi:hypothetical protein